NDLNKKIRKFKSDECNGFLISNLHRYGKEAIFFFDFCKIL
ncbi:unnamed protein product, partial [marine sediment metagenome]